MENLNGIDWNQYQSWRQVRTPSGGVYYAVPNTPYVYDPFLSGQRGKPVLWKNPEPEQQERERAQQIQDEQLAAQRRASSPEGQLLPVAGGIAGTAGALYVANKAPEWWGSADKPKPQVETQPTIQPTTPQPQLPNSNGSLTNPGVVATPGDAFAQGAMQGPQNLGTVSSNAPVVNDVKVVPAGQSVPEGYTAVGASSDGTSQIAVPSDQVPQDGAINFGQAAQGLLGAYQLYGAYRAAREGDYLGAGVMGASGAAGIGAALGNQAAAGALPWLGPVAGAYTIYKTDQAIGSMPQGSDRNTTGAVGGAAAGAAIGSAILPGYGTAIGAGIGGLVGLGASLVGSNKDKYQMIRDEGRTVLREQGILDDNYMGTLADGSTFDFGKDGKKYGKPQFDNPLYGSAAAYGNVLASVEGLSGKGREAMAMMYGNAAVSNAGKDPNTVLANYQHFARQRGITYEAGKAQLDKMLAEKQIKQDEYNVYVADLGKIVPPGSQPQTAQKGAGVVMGPMQPVAPAPQAQPYGLSQSPAGMPAGAAPSISGALQNLGVTRGPGPAPSMPIAAPMPPPRSSTKSPGVSLSGQRIPYDQERLGKALATRMNRKR